MFGFGAVYGMAQDWPRSRRCSSHIHKEEERRQVLHRYFWKKVGSAARHPTIKTYKNNKEPWWSKNKHCNICNCWRCPDWNLGSGVSKVAADLVELCQGTSPHQLRLCPWNTSPSPTRLTRPLGTNLYKPAGCPLSSIVRSIPASRHFFSVHNTLPSAMTPFKHFTAVYYLLHAGACKT